MPKASRRSPTRTRPAVGKERSPWLLGAAFLALAFVLYGNTLGHLYALDDSIVISDNAFTRKGVAGIGDIFTHDTFRGYFQTEKNLVSGGRYRPLSLATFALEYQFAGAAPRLSHFVNVLLYGITGALLYVVLFRLVGSAKQAAWWSSAPFLVTLLFMVHPLHTEVVANIKGRDELLAMLWALASLHFGLAYHDGRPRPAFKNLVAACLCVLLAVLAKESALPFLLLIPMAMWFFRKSDTGRLGAVLGALVVPTLVYFLLRSSYAATGAVTATDEILNDPFVGASAIERVATVFKTLGIYLRLFLVPHPLSHDYYYNQVPVTGFANFSALWPLGVATALGVVAVAGVRGKSPAAFGLLFFAASFSIVSNLFFSIGTTMAERFLYVPSLGLAIALVYALRSAADVLTGSAPARTAAIVVLCVSSLFAVTTIRRNPAWKDNLTLFTTDVRTSPRSAKLQTATGGILIDAAIANPDSAARGRMLQTAIGHLEEALTIYPRHAVAWNLMGNAEINLGDDHAAKALECYAQAIRVQPEMALVYKNSALVSARVGDFPAALASIRRYRSLNVNDTDAVITESDYLERLGQIDEAIAVCEASFRAAPQNDRAWGRIGMLYGKYRNDYPQAIRHLERAVAIAPTNPSHYENLGAAQAMSGQVQAAVRTFENGLARAGNSASLNWNLALAWQRLEDPAKAQHYFEKARQLSAERR